MKVKTPSPIGAIFSSSKTSILSDLVKGSRQHRTFSAHFQPLLPRELAHHCAFASLNREELVVIVASAAWATRLNYLSKDLIAQFNQRFRQSVKRLTIKIDSDYFMGAPSDELPAREATLSPTAHQCVLRSLEQCSDPILRQFLENLDRTFRSQQS